MNCFIPIRKITFIELKCDCFYFPRLKIYFLKSTEFSDQPDDLTHLGITHIELYQHFSRHHSFIFNYNVHLQCLRIQDLVLFYFQTTVLEFRIGKPMAKRKQNIPLHHLIISVSGQNTFPVVYFISFYSKIRIRGCIFNPDRK